MRPFDPTALIVTDNPEAHRFEADLGGALAVAEYTRTAHRITFIHTEVPRAYRLRGIGEALVRGALEHVRKEGLIVRPHCPFVRSYIEAHPEYHDLLRPADRP